MPRWLFWTFVTLLSWGIWAVLSRLIGGGLSAIQSNVASTVGILPVLLALWWMPEPGAPGRRCRGMWMAFGSGIVSCLGNIAYYDVLSRGTKAAAVVPYTALYPVVTVVLAAVLLKERMNRIQVLGIALSLAAIYLFNVPSDTGAASAWLLYALIPVALWGLCGLMQKVSTNDISARSSAIWFLAAFIPVAAALYFYDPLPRGMTWKTWAAAAALGFTMAAGNFTILLAFASGGKASIIAPLAGLYPIVSLPICILMLGESIGWREGLGIALAMTAVVMLSYQSQPAAADDPRLDTETP